MPLVQHPAHSGDRGTPERSRLPAPAGAPVGAVCSEAAALLHAARRGGTQYGAGGFLRVIAQSLQTHSPGAANVPKATLHIGAVAFIHRFGFCLNGHAHFKLRGRWTAGLPGSGYSWSSATTEDLPDESTGCLTAKGLLPPFMNDWSDRPRGGIKSLADRIRKPTGTLFAHTREMETGGGSKV